MSTIAESVKHWAIADGATDPQIKFFDDGKAGQYGYSINMGELTVRAWIDFSEVERFLVINLYPDEMQISAPERLSSVAQLLSWINDSLWVGNFELTEVKGRLRFRAGVPVSDEGIPDEVIESMVTRGMQSIEKYFETICSVAIYGTSPAEAWRNATNNNEKSGANISDMQDILELVEYPGTAPLVEWAADVRRACAEGADREDWRLIGPAIAIVTEDPSEVSSVIYALAKECGITCTEFEPDAIAKLPRHDDQPPMLYYLMSGDWQRHDDDDKYDDAAHAGRQRLLRNGVGLFDPAHPAIYVTVVRSISNLAPQLRAVGAFDRYFIVPPPSFISIGGQFIKAVGKERCAESITSALGKVGKLLNWHFDTPTLRKLVALRLQRLYSRLDRSLEFFDLVEATTQELLEGEMIQIESDVLRSRVAYHEAGHVSTALLDSYGRDIPEYSCIIPWSEYKGVMVESVSYSYAKNDLHTYRDFCHDIRVRLGGRAAEEIIFGPEGISTGSSSDLKNCGEQATNIFSRCGFAPAMEEEGVSASNLAVIIGNPTDTEYQHIELLTRNFLAREYNIVLTMLRENRRLLEAVTSCLKEKALLDQHELESIWCNFKVGEEKQEPMLEAA